MTSLQIGSIIFGMVFSAASVVFAMGVIVQKFRSHEELDKIRFQMLHTICNEIREDVKELRKAV